MLHEPSLSHLAFRLLCFRGFFDTHTHTKVPSVPVLLLLPIFSPPFMISAPFFCSPPSLRRAQTGRRENDSQFFLSFSTMTRIRIMFSSIIQTTTSKCRLTTDRQTRLTWRKKACTPTTHPCTYIDKKKPTQPMNIHNM